MTQIFSIAASILDKYFDLYKEETSEKLNLYMVDVAPRIFGLLTNGIDSAKDVKYFECIQKYIT